MRNNKLELLENRIAGIKQVIGAVSTLFMLAGIFAFGVAVVVAYADAGAGAFAIAIAIAVLGAITFVFIGVSTDDNFIDFLIRIIDFTKSLQIKKSQLSTPSRYKLLKLSQLLFSAKTQNETFLPAMSDWDEEIFELLKKDKYASVFMINVRNAYGFIMAMWQKSPLGDLLEYVRKIAS
jgi:hypothetical protein